MVYFIPDLLSVKECEFLSNQFDNDRKHNASTDEFKNSGVLNSYGFKPTNNEFNIYLDKLVSKILTYNHNITDLVKVNTYVREYRNESFLEKHTDRKDISTTMSICLDSTIKKKWPLFTQIDGKEYSFNTNVGDAILLFDADKHIHWREELVCEENQRVLQFFLHWKPVTHILKKQKTII
jgi:hypothetical protein